MPDRPKHLLLVEDEPQLRAAVAEQLRDRGFEVKQADSGEAALSRLSEFAFDIVITDLRLPGIDGSAVIEAAVERYPEIVAIVMTGFGTVKDAVQAIKRGASDFVSKPFQIDELLHALDAAVEKRRLKSENAYLRAQLEERYRFDAIVGRSRAMAKLFRLLETVAATNSTILITGETGTGKEVVARAIHHNSARRAHQFVALNCSAIPETLLEAELFGHVRGAFTGAVGNRQGRVEQAHKGTLFLDEVGTMSPALQVKLLRVLQEREFQRIGDSNTIKVDVRVIAATNSDLRQMVDTGQFREDLFYRLNVIPVQLPPLRERREDIPLLVQHFLDKFRAEGRPPMTVAQDAMRRLMSYHWPGNVRQLENAIERAIAISDGRSQIDVTDLLPDVVRHDGPSFPSTLALPEDGLDLDAFVSNIERELIQRSLERTGGNKGQAARLLNLKRTTLVEKLKRLERLPLIRVVRYCGMPPRYAYWTILIDNGATAFRAREQSELLPTLHQLRRTNKDVVMKWFSHGRLWESPEEARRAREVRPPRAPRSRDWRPGGEHKDPRARFSKPKGGQRFESDQPRRKKSASPRLRAERPAGDDARRPQERAAKPRSPHNSPFKPRRPRPPGKPGPPRRR